MQVKDRVNQVIGKRRESSDANLHMLRLCGWLVSVDRYKKDNDDFTRTVFKIIEVSFTNL